MGVVGDPFWLGESEPALLNKLRRLTSYKGNIGTYEDQFVMDNITREPYLLLNLLPPRDMGDKGIWEVSRDQVMAQTVYRIERITSTFDGGKFTQKLEGTIVKRSLNKE